MKSKSITARKTKKAIEYGYEEKRAIDIGKARGKQHKSKEPVAIDTNKTTRKRALPLNKGAKK